ncbi:MAG TPA: Xaa-Pro dipeptidase [Holophagaceae bacterium]|nr:Xaa-Pro dipeptidase [Holophagaceae bacterium]
MTLKALFLDHLTTRRKQAEEALSHTGFEVLVLGSGEHHTYFADDQEAPFHAVPHFAHWCPIQGPHHLLVVRPGQKPTLIRFAPEDFWYEQADLEALWGGTPFWAEGFDIVEAATVEAVWERLGKPAKAAFIGTDLENAGKAGLALNPDKLTKHLDWTRSFKTSYEVKCLEEATALAAKGHDAAQAAFLRGDSELEIHHAYVQAVGCVDHELPYGTIVALDEKGAILHYEGKRKGRNGRVLLIDAGAKVLGYGSDITRTWAAPTCDPRFKALLVGMEKLQLELCDEVKPGLHYGELHKRGHLKIAALLHEAGILKVGAEEAVELGLSKPFFPHGLGHHLGIQVHDVAGKQLGPDGEFKPSPAEHPFLRTTRIIEEGQVFTVEPGLYFIPMLLRPFRTGEHAAKFDWQLIDALTPLGGIRIEDNLLVTATGHRNLTRTHLPH